MIKEIITKQRFFKNEMSEDQKNFAIKTTQKGFSMYKDHFECAKYVKEQFENMVVLVLVIIML